MTVLDDYVNCTLHNDESACDVAGSAFSSGGGTWAASVFFAFGRRMEERLLNKAASQGASVGKVRWTPEGTTRSAAADAYEAGASGARSELATGKRLVPALDYARADGTAAAVRFDGLRNGQLIDRKLGVATTQKSKLAATRQSMALAQNGRTAIWEVGDQRAYRRATRMLGQQNIVNIKVRIVEP